MLKAGKMLLFASLMLLAAADSCQAGTSRLVVEGNKLKLDGKEVLLRGVAVGDPRSRAVDYRRAGRQDYAEIKKWRANIVRISVHPGNWLRDNRRTRLLLENEIADARRQGLIVMVDWHVIGWPDGWFKTGDSDDEGFTFESDLRYAQEFWRFMAVKYKNDQGVIFELWNEPADAENERSWRDLRPAMQRLHDLVRQAGAPNILAVPGVDMATDLRGIKEAPIKGKNIIYAWHSYPDNTLKKDWYQAFANLNDKYPVMLSEWGYSLEPGASDYVLEKDQRYYEPMERLIREKKLHFTAWCWHSAWQPALVKKDWRTPTAWGKLLKQLLSDSKR
jgi:hypothetical protein